MISEFDPAKNPFSVRRKDDDTWVVNLPHQCEEWTIAGEGWSKGVAYLEALEKLESFIAYAEDALDALFKQECLEAYEDWDD